MAIDRWFFPTNIENFKAILTYGLICGSVGYKKYYSDISIDYPGFIPIFRAREGGFSDELSKAKEEDEGVILCLIEINLDVIESGNFYLLNNEQIGVEQLREKSSDECPDTVLIPGPLPLSCIKQVLFNDKENITTFRGELQSYGNLPKVLPKLIAAPKSDKKLFTSGKGSGAVNNFQQSTDLEHPAHTRPAKFDVSYEKVFSLGGLICTLFYFSKNSSSANNTLKQCTKLDLIDKIEDELIHYIIEYFYHNDPHTQYSNPTFIIIHHVLGILVNKNKDECIPLIVNFLKTGNYFDKPDEKKRAGELSNRLSGFFHNKIDAKASEIFSDSASRIEKMLLLMVHRNDVDGLMKPDLAGLNIFDETDYIVSGMLFGVRNKYNKIPILLRQYSGVHGYISYLMAQYAHNTANTGIKLNNTHVPLTVMDMVDPSRRDKSKKLGFINWLSNKLDIQHCFETVMPSKKFENDRGKSTYDGVVLPEIAIKKTEYFKAMSRIEIDDKLYDSISNKFKTA